MFEMFPEQSPIGCVSSIHMGYTFLTVSCLLFFESVIKYCNVNVRLDEKDWFLAKGVKERKAKSFDPGRGWGRGGVLPRIFG